MSVLRDLRSRNAAYALATVLVLLGSGAADAAGGKGPGSGGGGGKHGTKDTTPPAVTVAAPTAGAVVDGMVSATGSASDNVGVTSVAVSVDGGSFAAANGTATWTFALDTGPLADGAHALTVRATDNAGNASTATVSVDVEHPVADTTPPTIAISVPSAGATVSGTTTVSGTAADDSKLAAVDVRVDGGPYAAATGTGAWSIGVATTGLSNGTHTLTARATDASGNTTTASTTVSVQNVSSLPAGIKEQLVTPEGATIQIASDVTNWTAQQVYDLLKPNALELSTIGPLLKIVVQTQYASSTTTGVSGGGCDFYNYRAKTMLDARPDRDFNSRPDKVIAHEYGLAWAYYHLYMSQCGNWTPYLVERGVADDPRLDSTLNWDRAEMIADDYRLLFGTRAAQDEAAYVNPDVADPRTVSGLGAWLAGVWGA